jgi:hypothetical protein
MMLLLLFTIYGFVSGLFEAIFNVALRILS